MRLNEQYGKSGFFIGLTTFFILSVSVRWLLDVDLGLKNYFTFFVFSLTVGIIATLILFYRWNLAFWIFFVSLVLGFVELFRNFIFVTSENADSLGILGLYSFTAIGCGIGIIIQLVLLLLKKA